MEIPDVIAINKIDHPAAKTMLNEVRSILALDHDRDVAAADRAHRGDARRGRRPSSGRRSRRTARTSRSDGRLEERRRRNLAGEVFAVASARAKAHLEHAVADDPELRRLLDEVAAPRARPADAPCMRSLEKVFTSIGDVATRPAPTLADIEAARERIDGRRAASRRCTARRRSRGSPAARSGSRPRTSSARARSRSAARSTARDARRRRSARRAWSRRAPATTARRSPGRRARLGVARDDLHAAGRADGEGRGDAGTTAPSVRWAARDFEDALARRARARRGDRRDVRPRVRGRSA